MRQKMKELEAQGSLREATLYSPLDKESRPVQDSLVEAPPGVTSSSVTRTGLLVYTAAGLSLIAALIHLWVVPEHFGEWWGYGAFMLVAAACQGLFSLLVLRFPRSALISLSGIAGNLIIVLLYVISHTWGMPFGASWIPFDPSVAHLEDAEVLGMSATLAEVGIIFSCGGLLDRAYRKVAINALFLLGVLVWALRLTGILP